MSIRRKYLRRSLLALIPGLLLLSTGAQAQPGSVDGRLYEMRTYYAEPGKFEALSARFRDHAMRLFSKHGMTNVAYWTKEGGGDGTLIYILSHQSPAAREAAWAAFRADPEWQAVVKATEANGKLTARMETSLMRLADYSPAIHSAAASQ
jgi:hypothetical protein